MLTKTEYRTIGFAGSGQIECIAGCAILLRKQGKKLLLMDFSKTAELRSMIPLPKDLEYARNFVLSYREYDYINADDSTNVEDYAFDYDFVLVDFGRNIHHAQIGVCNEMFYITDLRRHNVLILKQYEKTENQHVILKHFLPGGETPESIAEELNIDLTHLFVLPYEEKEMIPFLCGTPIDKINFRHFSYDTRNLISHIINEKNEIIYEPNKVQGLGKKPRNIIERFCWKGREHVWS